MGMIFSIFDFYDYESKTEKELTACNSEVCVCGGQELLEVHFSYYKCVLRLHHGTKQLSVLGGLQ